MSHDHPPRRVTPGQRPALREPPLTDVIVLVAGTTEPLNMDPKHRARSYSVAAAPADDSYWGKSQDFIDALNHVCGVTAGARLFPLHGWSGDNAVINRQVAGAYLARRFCTLTKSPSSKTFDLPPYYEACLKNKLSFHLIGHSHGGNVINEFTKEIATLPEWPDTWKVKSIVYLSTPFFGHLHQVNTSKFDAKARILSVYNEYDLTQRVIADFSMLPLPNVVRLIEGRKDRLSKALNDIRSFSLSAMGDALLSGSSQDSRGVSLMAPAKGVSLYTQSWHAVGGIRDLFQIVAEMVDLLASNQTFFVLPELRGRVRNHRKVIADAVAARMRAAIQPVIRGADETLAAFDARIISYSFPVDQFATDWLAGTFVKALVDLIRFDPDTLHGKLTDLIADILIDQLDVFDDTTNQVAKQLADTPYANAVEQVQITNRDPFDQYEDARGHFRSFVRRLESCEESFGRSRGHAELLDLFFTLVTQMAQVDGAVDFYKAKEKSVDFDYWARLLRGLFQAVPGGEHLADLLEEIRHYLVALSRRYSGSTLTDASGLDGLQVGDVEYFAEACHAMSHRLKIDEIPQFLLRQMSHG